MTTSALAPQAIPDGLDTAGALDSQELLLAMQAVQEGDFSVRLPRHWTGLPGKIADTFNAIVAANQRMAAALKAAGYPYRFIYADEVTHAEKYFAMTMAYDLMFIWHGYEPAP